MSQPQPKDCQVCDGAHKNVSKFSHELAGVIVCETCLALRIRFNKLIVEKSGLKALDAIHQTDRVSAQIQLERN